MRLVELFGGLAPYCLWAMGTEAQRVTGRRYRLEPPVGRMGSKTGFVPSVLQAWGMKSARWDSVWANDPDPVCHIIHQLYADTELRRATAARLWSWVPCHICKQDLVCAALRGESRLTREQVRALGVTCDECRDGGGVRDARRLWESIRSAPVPGDVVEFAAAAVFMQSRSFRLKPITVQNGRWLEQGNKLGESGAGMPPGRDTISTRLESLPHPSIPARLTQLDAALCLPTGDASDAVVILDPPYLGTSGYQHDAGREMVLTLAHAWSDAGALVLLHEACPLDRDLGPCWGSRVATPLRSRGSTFWSEGGEREWVTFNRPPIWWPEQQVGLFGEKHA